MFKAFHLILNNKIEYKNKFQESTALGGLVASASFFTGTH